MMNLLQVIVTPIITHGHYGPTYFNNNFEKYALILGMFFGFVAFIIMGVDMILDHTGSDKLEKFMMISLVASLVCICVALMSGLFYATVR